MAYVSDITNIKKIIPIRKTKTALSGLAFYLLPTEQMHLEEVEQLASYD